MAHCSRGIHFVVLGLLAGVAPATHADVVTDWNVTIASCFASEPADPHSGGELAIAWAVAHLAMRDAIRATIPAGSNAPPDPVAGEAAAATAAHAVLMALSPKFSPFWHEQLRVHLAALPESSAATVCGVQAGRAAAADALRHPAARGLGPPEGAYRDPGRTPLMLRWLAQFRAQTPYHFGQTGIAGPFGGRDEFHGLVERSRAGGSTEIVRFWSGSPELVWNRIARSMVERNSDTLLAHAKFFAALNLAIADAGLAALESQEYFGSPHKVRRTTDCGALYVRTFSSANATLEATLTQDILVPAVPGYPSRNASIAGAAAAVLQAHFGRHASAIVLAPGRLDDGAGSRGVVRSFPNAVEAARECAIVSFLDGRDIVEADIGGFDQGTAIGRWIARRLRVGQSRP